MESGDRRVELMLKQFKVGRWNVGMQKGLFKYDKSTYDRERELYSEFADRPGPLVDQSVDLEDFIQDDEPVENEEEGINGINDLAEDYMDGNYYREDADNDNDF